MTIRIGTRIPPKLGELGIGKAAEWAAGIGLQVLDVPALTPEIKQACDAAGLSVGTVDAVGVGQLLSRDPAWRAAGTRALSERISETAALGGSKLFLCLVPEDPAVPRSETFDIWKEAFPSVVAHAEREGVYLAVEGWPGPAPHYPAIGCTPELLRAMFEAIPSKHLGLNYDPSHLIRLGIDHLRVLDEFGGKVIHVHGKDTQILAEERYLYGIQEAAFGAKLGFSEGSWRYTIPGDGDADWVRIKRKLDELGYTGAVSIELEDHYYWGSLELEQAGIRKAAACLSGIFGADA